MPTRTWRVPPSAPGSATEMSSQPLVHSGSSYCEIWKFFGMSG